MIWDWLVAREKACYKGTSTIFATGTWLLSDYEAQVSESLCVCLDQCWWMSVAGLEPRPGAISILSSQSVSVAEPEILKPRLFHFPSLELQPGISCTNTWAVMHMNEMLLQSSCFRRANEGIKMFCQMEESIHALYFKNYNYLVIYTHIKKPKVLRKLRWWNEGS